MAKLIDVNGKPMGVHRDPPQKNTPDYEMLRLLRIVETARRTGIAELCAQLQECFNSGWSLNYSEELGEGEVEITIISHLTRDAENKLRHRPERWLRMGKGYCQAIEMIKAENERN